MSVTLSPHAAGPRRLMNETGDYYTRAAAGQKSTLALSSVALQLSHKSPLGVMVASDSRAEQTSQRWCYFDPAITLPTEHGQFEIAGVRWNVTVGSVGDQPDRAGRLLYRYCHLVRAST